MGKDERKVKGLVKKTTKFQGQGLWVIGKEQKDKFMDEYLIHAFKAVETKSENGGQWTVVFKRHVWVNIFLFCERLFKHQGASLKEILGSEISRSS